MRRVIIEEEKIPLLEKQKGQYFTIDPTLQQWIFDHVRHKNSPLLEPSCGAGHLLTLFLQYNPSYPMTCYELDAAITPVVSFSSHQTIMYGDFTTQVIDQRFRTIIGNPPYVKQPKGNLYLTFIRLCVDLLTEDGELLFIIPSDFFKITGSSVLIERMVREGSFTDVYYPHNEKLFKGASVDVMAFRYQKGIHTKKTMVNQCEKLCHVRNGIVTFHEERQDGIPLSDVFDVAVGMVSGRDKVFEHALGNVQVLVDQDTVKTFLYVDHFPTNQEEVNAYLLGHKQTLLERRIRPCTEKNWFQWGAPRNKKFMDLHKGRVCIYVRTITRRDTVAFLGTVQPFGGTLLCLVPKQPMSQDKMRQVIDVLNSSHIRMEYTYAGRCKIGHKQVSNMMVPL